VSSSLYHEEKRPFLVGGSSAPPLEVAFGLGRSVIDPLGLVGMAFRRTACPVLHRGALALLWSEVAFSLPCLGIWGLGSFFEAPGIHQLEAAAPGAIRAEGLPCEGKGLPW